MVDLISDGNNCSIIEAISIGDASYSLSNLAMKPTGCCNL
jgi:hypothetical protein